MYILTDKLSQKTKKITSEKASEIALKHQGDDGMTAEGTQKAMNFMWRVNSGEILRITANITIQKEVI